jgi:nucleolar MIF4G domain-containing protein 1
MQGDGKQRYRFLVEALEELKNNKSKRSMGGNAEVLVSLRKWISSMRRVLVESKAGKSGSDTGGSSASRLKITLQDFLSADERGRWWKAGAAWKGVVKPDVVEVKSQPSITVSNDQLSMLEEKSKKLHMNTGIRKSIFMIVMTCRDVNDAFERLMKLQLKGQQDREVVRVVAECCGYEQKYNEFYAQLLELLCSQNRQNKTTLQFFFWDLFRQLEDDADNAVSDRRAINSARLMAHLVVTFCLSLSVLKSLSMSDLSQSLVLFLGTFFMAIFSSKVLFCICHYYYSHMNEKVYVVML